MIKTLFTDEEWRKLISSTITAGGTRKKTFCWVTILENAGEDHLLSKLDALTKSQMKQLKKTLNEEANYIKQQPF